MILLYYTAPFRFAALHDRRILAIIDEFQNITRYIYPDRHYQTSPVETLPGRFHSTVESKVAPMPVTESYVRWLIEIAGKYLETGRLSKIRMTPYLNEEEGLKAVYKYSDFYGEPISNETAVLINE